MIYLYIEMRCRAKPATVLTERWYPLFVWRGEGIHIMFGRALGTDFRYRISTRCALLVLSVYY